MLRPSVPPALSFESVLGGVESGAAMCVLASGSSGNCTVVVFKRGSVVRAILIDLGLSPRRTFKLLAERGIRPDQLDGAILTHLDTDHFRWAWIGGAGRLPPHARIRLHRRHARSDAGATITGPGCTEFDGPFDLDEGVSVRPMVMSHDEAGVCTLRIDMPGLGAGSMGFCTDLGRVTADLVDHLRADHGHGAGVDVLAMESNYCPKMQIESPRPWFLKRRIMGGRGHLSNQEAAEAVQAITPREHVVLLHLSRECNTPALAAEKHAGSDYALTVTDQFTPTRWIRLAPSARAASPVVSTRLAQTATLWGMAG